MSVLEITTRPCATFACSAPTNHVFLWQIIFIKVIKKSSIKFELFADKSIANDLNKNLKLSKPTYSVFKPKGSGKNKEFQIACPEG